MTTYEPRATKPSRAPLAKHRHRPESGPPPPPPDRRAQSPQNPRESFAAYLAEPNKATPWASLAAARSPTGALERRRVCA